MSSFGFHRSPAAARLPVVASLALLGVAVPCRADASPPGAERAGTASNGLPGLAHVALPEPATGALAADAGFGLTPPFAGDAGSHQRGLGSLGIGYGLTSWLALAAKVIGTYDRHPEDDEGADSSLQGVPTLGARVSDCSDAWAWGADLEADLPGAEAPSLRFEATRLTLRALGVYRAKGSPLSLAANIGFRWDNSANAAPDLVRLRQGDRIALGLSDYDALPVALGAAYALDRAWIFGELSHDWLLGAPEPSTSPSRFAVGYRRLLTDRFEFEVQASTTLSAQPGVASNDPLIPIEPRFGAGVGLRVRFGSPATINPSAPTRAAASAPLPPRPEPKPEPPKPVALPSSFVVVGQVLDGSGKGLPQVDVRLHVAEQDYSTLTTADGSYSFTSVPAGTATLYVETADYESQRHELTIGGEEPVVSVAPVNLHLASLHAQLRGLVQTFDGQPIRATIRVTPPNVEHQSDASGNFTIDLEPGHYKVEITAAGYQTQVHEVDVQEKGVVVLNADLRKAR